MKPKRHGGEHIVLRVTTYWLKHAFPYTGLRELGSARISSHSAPGHRPQLYQNCLESHPCPRKAVSAVCCELSVSSLLVIYIKKYIIEPFESFHRDRLDPVSRRPTSKKHFLEADLIVFRVGIHIQYHLLPPRHESQHFNVRGLYSPVPCG